MKFVRRLKLKEVPLPPTPKGRHSWDANLTYLDKSRGAFHFIKIDPSSTRIKVHEMTNDHVNWHIIYTVNVATLALQFPKLKAFAILCLVKGLEEEEDYLVVQVRQRILKVGLESGILEVLGKTTGN